MYEMAKDKNVLSSCQLKWDNFHFVRSNGEALPVQMSEKLSKLCMEICEADDKTEEMRAYNGSLGNFYAKE